MSMIENQINELNDMRIALYLALPRDVADDVNKKVKNAIATIQSLSAKLHEQNVHGGWIPCEERLPDPQKMGDTDFSDDVQVCMSNNMVTDAYHTFM